MASEIDQLRFDTYFGPVMVTGASDIAAATLPSFQSAKDNATRALPLPASSGTRTGPWNRPPQQRSLRTTRTSIGLAPGRLLGNATFATG